MDVVNMSIGGSHGKSGNVGFADLLMNGVDDLDQAGMISAVAAGNAGPGFNTVESPGAAARALTAGAVTVGHFIGAPVTNGASTYGAEVGDFATVSSDLTANLNKVGGGTGTACSALTAGSLTGQIALISRGTCSFTSERRGRTWKRPPHASDVYRPPSVNIRHERRALRRILRKLPLRRNPFLQAPARLPICRQRPLGDCRNPATDGRARPRKSQGKRRLARQAARPRLARTSNSKPASSIGVGHSDEALIHDSV
jgi:hypothetical protein